MTKTLAVLFLMHAAMPGYAQKIAVVKRGNLQNLERAEDFAYIEKATDTASYQFVGTYKATEKKAKVTIGRLFSQIEDRAKADGANCFKLVAYTQNDTTGTTLILDAYYWSDSIRVVNFSHHETNVIYILGGEKSNNETVSFKIGDEKKIIPSGTWYKLRRRQGEEIRINKGGVTGSTIKYVLDGDKPAIFLGLSGFAMEGASPPFGTGAGVAFNTGRIERLPGDFGQLLIHILSESPIK